METVAQKLRIAYDLIVNADTTDIDAYYLAVEEALGYIAEALDLADEGVTPWSKYTIVATAVMKST